MVWFLRKKPKETERPRVLEGILPTDDQRLGPEPPPPPSKTPPGVTVFSVEKWASKGPVGKTRISSARPGPSGETCVVRIPSGTRWDPGARDTTLVLLAGRLVSESGPLEPGDVLLGSRDVESTGSGDAIALLYAVERPPGETRRVGGRELVGTGFSGITGIRRVFTRGEASGLRLGPPPGARWALVGLWVLALESGLVLLVDGNETREVRAGEIAVLGDPRATLYLVVGNDSARGFAFASRDVLVRLG